MVSYRYRELHQLRIQQVSCRGFRLTNVVRSYHQGQCAQVDPSVLIRHKGTLPFAIGQYGLLVGC